MRLFPRLVLDGIAGLKFLKEGKYKETLAIVKAHWHFFAAIPKLLRKRRFTPHHSEMKDLPGYYPKSVLWQYFAKKKRHFRELN